MGLRERLFAAAALHVRGRMATAEFLLEQATAFAEAFAVADDHDDHIALAETLYCRVFADGFRPGMSLTPSEALRSVDHLIDGVVLLLAEAKASELRQNAPKVLSEQNAAQERERRAEEAKQAREQREAEIVEQQAAQKQAEDELLNPQTVAATPVEQLAIDKRAKTAYVKFGLLTVGDVETYAKSAKLEDIKGVGEAMAKDTLEEIAKLYAADASE